MTGGSDEGARLLEVVHAEGHLRMSAHAAQMDQAHDVDPRITEAAGEARERARPVVEADHQDRSARARIPPLHQRLSGLHRLVHDEAHVGSSAGGLRADRVDVDSSFAEDRRKFRELPRLVWNVDIELDHEGRPRQAWRFHVTRVPRRRSAAERLSRAARLTERFPCGTVWRTSGSRCRTWTERSASTHPRSGCAWAGDNRSPRRGASGPNSGVLDPNRSWNGTGTRKDRGSSRGHTATGMNSTTSRSSARTSTRRTANSSRRGRALATRLSKRAGRSSPTSWIPTESGSSCAHLPLGPADEGASRPGRGRSERRRRDSRLLSEARRRD